MQNNYFEKSDWTIGNINCGMLPHNPICILDGRLLKGGNQVLKSNLDLTRIYSAHI